MNNYIFLIPSICNIGGAQLYLVHKMHYLQEKGWNVEVLYGRKDIILVKELEQYSDNCAPCLRFSTMYFRRKYVEQNADEIVNKITQHGKYSNLVVESCTVSLATWGELIASKLSCKHINFAFEELFEMSPSQLEFAFFKHKRHELAGIRPQSVPLMFKGSNYKIENPEHYLACSISSIEDVDDYRAKIMKEYDIVIGSFGRLDKGFVWDALIEIHKYMLNSMQKKYALLLIGDTKDTAFKKKIYRLFNGIADVIITGEVCPASLELVKQVDVFVSSSGAATATALCGIPTIAVSPETFKPNGILDYTTKYNIMAPRPSEKSISELITDIIDNQICKTLPSMGLYTDYRERKKVNDWKEFDRQLTIATDDRFEKEYYDIFKISLEGKRRLAGIYCHLFGANLYFKTIDFIKKYYGTLIKG